jgi:hypothetical protein
MNTRWNEFKLRYTSGIVDDGLSKLIDLNPPPLVSKPPLFIMGSGRNGSTLLSCILNNHPHICIPVEHSFIPSSIKYWYSHPFQTWNQKKNSIHKLLEKTNYWKLNLALIENEMDLLDYDRQHVNSIIEIVYRQLTHQNGKQDAIWGDKTPSNTQFIKLIKAQFPTSKILFLIRDPRDYLASMLNMDTNYQLDFLLWRWKDALSKYESLKSRYYDDVRLLKYETLVSDTEKVIQELVSWLGLDYYPGIVEGYSKNMKILHVDSVAHHQKILEPISVNSIGNWKTQLSPIEIKQTEQQAGKKMLELGYPLSAI